MSSLVRAAVCKQLKPIERSVDSSISVIRPSDHLVLDLEFRGVGFTAPSGMQPGEVRGAANAFLIVYFQPQHIHEQAFYQASQELPDAGDAQNLDPPRPPGLVQSRLSGPSRLVFTVPPGEKFAYTLDGVLDALPRLPLSVTPVAAYNPELTGCLPLDLVLRRFRSPPPPKVTKPADTHTAIEAPYRLILSPDDFGLWSHSPKPVTHDDWTELWHTRLGSRRNTDPRVRAVWSPDFNPRGLQSHFTPTTPTPVDPFRASLDARDRNELVHLTSNHYIDDFNPTPVETELFTLTSLGATLRVEGSWQAPSGEDVSPPGTLTVEQWRHEMSIGRDQFVRVVTRGLLVPFGHRASVVKITERRFFAAPAGQPAGFIAYLFQRIFLIVREPVRSYEPRSMPFRTVHIKTRITPNLADPASHELIVGKSQSAFWPYLDRPVGPDVPFLFDVAATDWKGKTVEFATPMAFVDLNLHDASPGAVITAYNEALFLSLRRPALGGQRVTFAPSVKDGDTALETNTMTFGADPRTGDGPRFQPKVDEADVVIPAVKQATAGTGQSTISWEPSYLAAGSGGNAIGNVADVFALVKGTPLDFGSTERSGGLVAPDLSISGLSRSLGPIGGVASDMVGGKFDPAAIFGTGVKLLGGITLSDIIDVLDVSNALAADKLPKLVTERKGDTVVTTYSWKLDRSEIRPKDLKDATLFWPGPTTTFTLKATVEKKLDAVTAPEPKVEGVLTDFRVRLIPPSTPGDTSTELIELSFDSVKFVAEPGKKVDVSVELRGFEFLGILAFVNRLQEFIPLDGFTDPPNLRLVMSPNPGVELGYSLGIPTIGIGIMTMQNVSLGASVYLPFGDNPLNFRFAFCERDQPFTLTVSLFGGGGFFAMEVGVDKVVLVEAALEFGASVALNLGVAQGQATIMAGFYFQKAGAEFTLTGYFRASGSLSVIGIITVSLVFYLGLSYASKGAADYPGALWGQAKLTVKVEILFFSTSVSISMEREFAGSDPRFRDLISPAAWTEYCNDFATYA
jgi:hypothetical protein